MYKSMAYDTTVADRLRQVLGNRKDIVEKKMFGGIAFMLCGNMLCGVNKGALMARVGPDQYLQALARPHAREMNFTGRSLKGFVYVDSDGFNTDQTLQEWLDLCENFVGSLPDK